MATSLTKIKQQNKNAAELPIIPDKLYFGIGEVAKLCDIKPHVLRYWEEEFESLKPIKRRGNRRFYQRKDVLLVRDIRELLYLQGFTIEGARTQLVSKKKESAADTLAFLERCKKNLEDVLAHLEK